MPTWRGRGLGHGLRRTAARTKKGGGVDRRRNGGMLGGREGGKRASLAIPGIVIVLLEGLTRGVRERPRENRKNPRKSDDVALPWPVPFRNKGGFRFC